MSEPKVISIGHFAGGSFGRAGNPSKVYEYFAVSTDQEAASHNVSKIIAFTTQEAAEQRLAEVIAQQEKERLARAERERQEGVRREIAGRVHSALESHLGTPLGPIQWSDKLIPDQRLTPAALAAIRAHLHAGPFYDARVNDQLYRVQAHPFAGSVVVALSLA